METNQTLPSEMRLGAMVFRFSLVKRPIVARANPNKRRDGARLYIGGARDRSGFGRRRLVS
jgi:hypothetical protein